MDTKDWLKNSKAIIIAAIVGMTIIILPSFAAAKNNPNGKTDTKPQLSQERMNYAIEYDKLRFALLDKEGDKMGDTEALQAVAVHFSRAFEKANKRLNRLEQRVTVLETDLAALQKWAQDTEQEVKDHRQRIEQSERSIKAHDEDLSSIFNWTKDVDNEIGTNGIGFEPMLVNGSGIKGRLMNLENQSANTTSHISAIASECQKLRQAVQEISFALRSLR